MAKFEDYPESAESVILERLVTLAKVGSYKLLNRDLTELMKPIENADPGALSLLALLGCETKEDYAFVEAFRAELIQGESRQ